jgi:hypothetical protein
MVDNEPEDRVFIGRLWLVGGREMRGVESLLRSAWDEDSKRVQPGESAGEVIGMELGSVVFSNK